MRLAFVHERLTSAGYDVDLMSLFEYPTPRRLADFLDANGNSDEEDYKFESAISERVNQQKTRTRTKPRKKNFTGFDQQS